MATVGELVEAAALAARQRYYAEHSPAMLPAGGGFVGQGFADPWDWGKVALRELGLWDAEVLEGKVYGGSLEIDHATDCWPGAHGQRVSVIVLPQESEDDPA